MGRTLRCRAGAENEKSKCAKRILIVSTSAYFPAVKIKTIFLILFTGVSLKFQMHLSIFLNALLFTKVYGKN